MSEPKKHHYLPEFYQKRWANSDGEVHVYHRPYDQIYVQKKYPAAVGFEIELYAIPSLSEPTERQRLEIQLFGKIDRDASDALTFMEERGIPPTDPKLKQAWTDFLLSLIHRTPTAIANLKKHYIEKLSELDLQMEEIYTNLKGANDPPTFQEYLLHGSPRVFDETLATLLTSVVTSEATGNIINEMVWGVGRCNEQYHGLMTSDVPVLMTNGLRGNSACLLLPIGPDKFFIAAHNPKVIEAFNNVDAKKLERQINSAIVSQATKLVVANHARHRRFVENRFCVSTPQVSRYGFYVWDPPLDLKD